MKRVMRLLLVIAVVTGMLAGCAQEIKQGLFEADNEILTYEKPDPQRTQLVISRTGNINVEGLCREFEARNPDIQVIYIDITGGNSGSKPLVEWIKRGCPADIVVSAAAFVDDEMTKQFFENLSGDPIIQEFEAAALQRTATDGSVYWLPGPSDISAMMYNKTLFEQYGWQTPATFDEFVALCDRIREDTKGEIEPWNPNAKYSDELTTALESFTYEELFGGVDNRTWYNGILSGEDAFTGHLEPYTEVIQTLIDHGILREEHFTYSATTRGKEFSAGKIAMINMNIYDADNQQYDFGYIPFPTTKGELGYLCDKYSCFVGVLTKERTDKQTDAIRRFLEYFSSEEGQATYIGNSIKVSNVKGVSLIGSDDLAALQPAIDAGHMFALLNFWDPISERSRANFHQIAIDMTNSGITGTECLATLDKILADSMVENQTKAPEVIAVAQEDMSILETSFYMADTYRKAAGADIGLIAHNEAYRGNLMRVFSGDMTPYTIAALKPRSFANDSKLVKLGMTGRQITEALNNPLGNESAANCIYAYSGLTCEIAPWNEPGTRYLSVKLADGAQLDMDKLYSVAAWDGTVAPQYISETMDTLDGTWEEHLTARIRAEGPPTPVDDGRATLVWN